jgi:cell division protein FtsB
MSSALPHFAIPHRAAARLRGTARPQPGRVLRLVAPMANRARRTPFVVVLLTVIGTGLVGLILISTAMQAQTFELARLSSQARDLQTEQEALQREVSELESPENLGPRALTLGMVPSSTPVYLQLPDGKVMGTPKPAEAKTNLRQVIR